MNALPTEAPEAWLVLQDLLVNRNGAKQGQREIDVSFRYPGGATGRRDFVTHWVHWYPAKMFHRIPSVFLDCVALPTKACVLDPFCGSGTVLLEANLRGHDAVGIDINPLARLISRVKTTPLNPVELEAQRALLLSKAKRSRAKPPQHPILDSWISSSARQGLHRLHTTIADVSDQAQREFFLIALTNIVRGVSLADPAIPPLVRLREERAAIAGVRYADALQRSRSITTSTVYSAFAESADKNIQRMAELYKLRRNLGRTRIPSKDADAASSTLQNGSVDAIITSPPYCGSQKYVRSVKLELLLSGSSSEELGQIDRQTLGTEAVSRRVSSVGELLTGDSYTDDIIETIYDAHSVRARMAAEYAKYLARFAAECLRILKPNGQLLIALGRSTIAGVPFPADRIFSRAGMKAGLKLKATLVDPIPSRGLMTQRHKTSSRMDHEYIVWMQRP